MTRRITLSVPDDRMWQVLQQLLQSEGLNAHNVLWELTAMAAATENNTTQAHSSQCPSMVTTASDEEDDSGASENDDDDSTYTEVDSDEED
uniref:Uncharacterized protein n=1 Tax=Chromera velia CCMP2878 TaxID=1169474 RepID=A0A0G4GRS0_9ALVE|eukprot:Cvel_23089.t1-p1 / transcript=Cvel_23089.t1 / gene=Cvel_23089 / organism=Chromera_velia_CCMP2878 / gene_product=hypothetical protein / transcript_product=hypothetical protein / location=Cvel_scaffold2341:4193-4462(+) / protein_length=90 / sequence_SO=supercontig / SO=protein_coding / is_pseudo=false